MKNTISHLALFVAATALTSFAGDPFAVPWYTIDGGGVMRASSRVADQVRKYNG